MQMKKNIFWALMLFLVSQAAMAQRFTDNLDRGLVVVQTGAAGNSKTNLVTWRRLANEYFDVKYNLYKDGTLLASGLTTTSYADNSNGTSASKYQVAAVVNGVLQAKCTAVTAWNQYVYNLVQRCATGYLDIPLATVYSRSGEDITSHYSPNDAEFADLDGDGQLEMIIKRINTVDVTGINTGTKDAKGNDIWNLYPVNSTEFNVIDAYDINWQTGAATLLWRIDCGPNMVSHMSTETNIIAYDWDEDGKAEVVLRGADNMIVYGSDGQTQLWTVGDMSVNTRDTWYSSRASDGASTGSMAYTHSGSEFLIYMNGLTGAQYQLTDYPLKRLESGETSLSTAWGDGYGHRSSKYFFGAPVLDGRKASLFMARGIYTRHKMIAMDLNRNTHTWSTRWTWNCNNSSSPWYGNGYHNFIIADVDEDGRDEIVYGSMVIDDNGKGLSTTGYEHGDAQHVSDLDPWRKGLEFFGCLEDGPYYGFNYRNATTSEVYYKHTAGDDDGRAIAGNFMNDYPGSIGRSSSHGIISCTTDQDLTSISDAIAWGDCNFRIYWDGDLCSEVLNSPGTAKEAKVEKPGVGRLFTSDGCNMNNDSKNNPCFQGDLIGDWREEIVVRCGTNVRVYTSGMGTNYSLPSLWFDHQYRQAMVWQMMAYNQPPHISYFLGESEGYTTAPPPYSMQDRTEIANNGTIGSTYNDKQIIACETGNMTINVEDGAAPWVFYDNAPSWVQGTDVNGTTGSKVKTDGSIGVSNLPTINYAYYTHTVTGGAFTGKMNLVKQGDGTLVLPTVEQTYTGKTDIWAGTVEFNGSFSQSPVWMNRFTTFNTNGGTFNGGLTMEYASTLNVGGKAEQSIGNVTVSKLTLNYGARVVIDVNSASDVSQNDQLTIGTLVINTKDWENGPQYNAPILQINAKKNLAGGRFPLGTVNAVTGDLSKWVIECSKAPADSYLELDGTTLYLVTGEAQILEEPTLAITNMVQTGDYFYPQISIAEGNEGVELTKKFVFTDINGKETTLENVETVSYFSEDYSSTTNSWNSRFSINNGTAYYKNGDSGGRNTYLDLSSYGAGSKYSLEFDAQMTIGYRNNTEVQNSQIAIYNNDASLPTKYVFDFLTANTMFSIQNSGTTTFIVDGSTSTTVQTKVWYHYLIEVDGTSVTYTITDTNGTTISSGSSTVANTTLGGIFVVNGRAGVMQFDNIKLYLPEVSIDDSFTFTEPGTLKVVLEAEGYESSEATIEVPEPYVKKYESPAYNEIAAADVATTLGEDYWNAESFTTRWANWNKTNAIYGAEYVAVQGKSTSGYVDKDNVVSINYVGSQYPTFLLEGFGIGHNKTNQPVVISADGLGDSYSIVYYKADTSWGKDASYDEGYQFADSEGKWSYTMSNNTFCKMIAWVRESLSVTYEMGDVNMDGSVDISDVVLLVNYILGSTTDAEAPGVMKYGDMDSSGAADISDVVAIVNKVLGQ
jgi:autotransporter-associated beta strand protein